MTACGGNVAKEKKGEGHQRRGGREKRKKFFFFFFLDALSKIRQSFSSEVSGKQNPRIFVPLRIRPVRSIT
jgi:hypothetical protein